MPPGAWMVMYEWVSCQVTDRELLLAAWLTVVHGQQGMACSGLGPGRLEGGPLVMGM